MIICATALYNSEKVWAMACRATEDRQVMEKSSDKTRSTGEKDGNLILYSCLENPTNSMKREKDMKLEDEPTRSVGVQYATGEEQRNGSGKNEEAKPK